MNNKLQSYFMKSAFLLAENSHCVSHHVGAVIVKDNRIISMGYNGSAPGCTNCDDIFDRSAPDYDRAKHSEWSNANEIHAEMNALMFAAKHDIGTDGCDMYCTMSPCNHCLKNLAMSGIKNVYYHFKYDRSELNPEILKKINIVKLTIHQVQKFIELNNLIYNG